MVTQLDEGMVVGRYKLAWRIAQGGMGWVWCAHDERLGRDVAVKLLPRILAADPSAERRFSREARAMGRLQHPNVVSVYDVGSADPGSGEDVPFLVMEMIRGTSLDILLGKGPLEPERAALVMEQVCRALSAAHQAGIIHRDLKPSNVMVTEDDHVKVLDFGLARLAEKEGQSPEETLTTPGMVLGSCPYMAPEQALGQKVGPQSDIFSCGSVLYEALAGSRAFDGQTPMRVLQAVVKCEYQPLPEIVPHLPEGLVEVVNRCLRPAPEDRYADCGELARALAIQRRLLTQSQMSLPPVIRSEVPARGDGMLRWWLLGAITFVAGVVVGTLLERFVW
jgi:serine/threonine-protein kinase